MFASLPVFGKVAATILHTNSLRSTWFYITVPFRFTGRSVLPQRQLIVNKPPSKSTGLPFESSTTKTIHPMSCASVPRYPATAVPLGSFAAGLACSASDPSPTTLDNEAFVGSLHIGLAHVAIKQERQGLGSVVRRQSILSVVFFFNDDPKRLVVEFRDLLSPRWWTTLAYFPTILNIYIYIYENINTNK